MVDHPIDTAVLRDLLVTLGDDTTALEELVDAFLGDAVELVDEAFDSVADDDAERFRRAVHSLKTTGATFGAMELSSLCLRLEQAARQGRAVAVDELDELAQVCRRAREALRHGIARLESG